MSDQITRIEDAATDYVLDNVRDGEAIEVRLAERYRLTPAQFRAAVDATKRLRCRPTWITDHWRMTVDTDDSAQQHYLADALRKWGAEITYAGEDW